MQLISAQHFADALPPPFFKNAKGRAGMEGRKRGRGTSGDRLLEREWSGGATALSVRVYVWTPLRPPPLPVSL